MKTLIGSGLAAALVVALAFKPVLANKHLVPEDSQFTRASLPPNATLLAPYHDMIITVLSDAFAQNVRARLIAMPSYTPEYAVGIKERPGGYAIFHLASKSQLWSYENLQMLQSVLSDGPPPGQAENVANAIAEYESRLPDDYHDVETDSCEIPLERETGERLLDVWEKLLLQTRYGDQPPLGRDGTDYHFSMRANGMLMAGKVWEPDPQSRTGAMVSITETMKNLCLTGDNNLLGQLDPQVDALLAALDE